MHTKHTKMTNLATFRVHIAPLGFEIDRIVLPLKQTKADKLWILAHDNRSEDLSAPYLEKIKKECKYETKKNFIIFFFLSSIDTPFLFLVLFLGIFPICLDGNN